MSSLSPNMQLIQSRSQLIRNILKLESYRNSNDPFIHDYYRSLLKNGFCYVMYRNENKIYFGPSRFIGYVNNNPHSHSKNEAKHGAATNNAIKRLSNSEFRFSRKMESMFQSFCAKHGIQQANHKRKYISLGDLDITQHDHEEKDLSDIENRNDIGETERQALHDARIGQGMFRRSLLKYWGKCPITKCSNRELLKASHIKPWRDCTDAERLDVYNGILLSPAFDTAFDRGLISFSASGKIIISKELKTVDAKRLGITSGIRINLAQRHLPYMSSHRKIFCFE